MLQTLHNNDKIKINLFGREAEVEVFSTDYRYDEEDEHALLSEEEMSCLNWLLDHVDISDYKKEITDYCNEQYEMIGDVVITEEDLEEEVSIFAIAINVTGVVQSNDGFVYPEISFCGDCECDPEHGICIGFRDQKFLGIESQDWTL